MNLLHVSDAPDPLGVVELITIRLRSDTGERRISGQRAPAPGRVGRRVQSHADLSEPIEPSCRTVSKNADRSSDVLIGFRDFAKRRLVWEQVWAQERQQNVEVLRRHLYRRGRQ